MTTTDRKKGLLAGLRASASAEKASPGLDRFARADLALAQAAANGDLRLGDPGSKSVVSNTLTEEQKTDAAARVKVVQITKVKDNPWNARFFYNPDIVKARMLSIARDGQQTPVTVEQDAANPGEYFLIDGHYRKQALLELGHHEIIILEIEPLSRVEAYRLSYVLNAEREGQTSYDDAMGWQRLMQEEGYTQDQVAEFVGVKKDRVSKTLAVLKLPMTVQEIVREHPAEFGFSVAYDLYQLGEKVNVDELKACAIAVTEGKMSGHDLKHRREKAAKAKQVRARATQYQLEVQGKRLGTIREFGAGRVSVELTGLTPEQQENVVAAIKRVLQ